MTTTADIVIFLLALGAVLATIVLIYRLILHVTRGQTRELRLFAIGASILAFAWLLEAINSLPVVHQGALSLVFAPFGIVWYVEHTAIIAGVILLIAWTWHYISLRLLPQFYLTVVAIGLTAFVLSTVIFTTVLFRNAESQALNSIEADVRTFSLAISELTDRTAFTAAAIAARSNLINAAQENNSASADKALGDPITDYNVAAAYILNSGGELVTSVGTESIVGQSFSQDPVTRHVLAGDITGSPTLLPGPETSTIVIRAGSPLVSDGKVVGAVLVDTPLDTAFVDRVGEVTGLDVTIFAREDRVATTLRDDTGRPLVPASIEDPNLADITLNQGKVFRSSSTLGGKPYFIAALPLVNIDESRIGVLSAGLSAQSLVDSLASSTKLSFFVAFGLLTLALAPFYLVAKRLAKNASQAR